jgi:hypothetical protein
MEQFLALVLAFSLGIAVCGVILHRVAVRWRLPWEGLLLYFGVLDHPADEAVRRRRPARQG